MELKKATFGAGCFWCIEAVFQELKGVHEVKSGYTGGHIKNPAYREVCTGTTGHNEVVDIHYDNDEISLNDLLEVFWSVHNPTTLNRQGADKGTQYRSGVYFHDAEDETVIQTSIASVAAKLWDDPIVTEVKPATDFYPAEAYHNDYYDRNYYAGYCQIVINPKLKKLKEKFSHKVKAEYNGPIKEF